MTLPLRRIHPLGLPLLAALVLRLGAAIWGNGYLMHDDHFLVVEAAASWADGEDYNQWLPWNRGDRPGAHPVNFAYPTSQFLTFKMLHWAGVQNPEKQALILRVLHGLYSLTTVLLGYLLTRSLVPGKKEVATTVAWMLAAGGLWPLLSVHQLVEMVCIPPLMLALWALARSENPVTKDLLLAGLGIGIATGLRYQCGMIGLGLIPVLLIQRRAGALLTVGLTALAAFFLMQAPDLLTWGKPFVQLQAYIEYNASHAGNYPQGPWYQYILTLTGLLIPPASLMILWGAIHRKKAPEIWWRVAIPVLVFFLFHSLFANKQERFILPVVPGIMALGCAGWALWTAKSRWWIQNRKLERMAWKLFWTISVVLLAITLPYSGKKTRVDAMTFLYDQGSPVFAMVQVDSGAMPPLFYAGSWARYHIDNRRELQENPATVASRWCGHPPAFILFQGDRHLAEAVAEYKSALPKLRYVTTIKPSRIDRWLHELNPINSVERIMVYATDDALSCP